MGKRIWGTILLVVGIITSAFSGYWLYLGITNPHGNVSAIFSEIAAIFGFSVGIPALIIGIIFLIKCRNKDEE